MVIRKKNSNHSINFCKFAKNESTFGMTQNDTRNDLAQGRIMASVRICIVKNFIFFPDAVLSFLNNMMDFLRIFFCSLLPFNFLCNIWSESNTQQSILRSRIISFYSFQFDSNNEKMKRFILNEKKGTRITGAKESRRKKEWRMSEKKNKAHALFLFIVIVVVVVLWFVSVLLDGWR